jgi:hypothetical protein
MQSVPNGQSEGGGEIYPRLLDVVTHARASLLHPFPYLN